MWPHPGKTRELAEYCGFDFNVEIKQTYERQESLQNTTELYFNIELIIRNILQDLLVYQPAPPQALGAELVQYDPIWLSRGS